MTPPIDLPLLRDLLTTAAFRLEEAAHELRAAAGLLGDDQPRARDPDKLAALLARSLDDLELSVRAVNVLHSAGIRTIGDLTVHTRRAVLKLPHTSARTVRELDEVLANLGLGFAEEERNDNDQRNGSARCGTS